MSSPAGRATVSTPVRHAGTRRRAKADDFVEISHTASAEIDERRLGVGSASIASSATLMDPASADAFDEAFAVVNDPGEGDPARLTRTIGLLQDLVSSGVRTGQCRAGIGRCLFRLGRNEESRGQFEEALATGGFGDFTRSWAWLRLGCIADLHHDRVRALGYYCAVLDLPDADNLRHQKKRALEFAGRPYLGYEVDR